MQSRVCQAARNSCTSIFVAAELTAEVSGYTSESRAAAQSAKQILQGLKKLGDELKQNKDADPRGTAQFRLFQNRYHEMYSKFHKAVGDNQVARATFKERVTDRAVSQARIIFPDRSEAELSTLVTANPQALQEHLQAPELVAHSNVQDVFDEVQERNEAINELVRSMAEINELMQDLAVLVQEQSEQLQRIDQQVGSTVQRIEKGNKELEKAIRYQKAARRKYCCIAIVGIIILVVILGSVIPTSGK